MDASSATKMNDMVKNLTKHGIISNSEEAVKMAEKMYNVGKGEKDKKESSADEPQAGKMHEKYSNDSDDKKQELVNLIDQRVKLRIDENNKAIILEFQKIWERLNKIMPEIEIRLAEIKQDIKISARDIGKDIPDKIVISDKPAVEKSVEDGPKESESAKSENDSLRSGKFKEEDVSVEKFFYFGKK